METQAQAQAKGTRARVKPDTPTIAEMNCPYKWTNGRHEEDDQGSWVGEFA